MSRLGGLRAFVRRVARAEGGAVAIVGDARLKVIRQPVPVRGHAETKLAGTIRAHGVVSMACAPSLTSAPQLVAGSCTPRPRKLRKDSTRITCGTVSAAYTTTTPSRLGTMWRDRMRRA